MTEHEMVIDVYNDISKKYKVILEVPFLSRCIDMVVIDNENKIMSIEFKISNWRHAVDQATGHSLGSDYPCICMPENKINKNVIQYAKQYGITVMSYDTKEKMKPFNNEKIINKKMVPDFHSILLKKAMELLHSGGNEECVC